MLTSLPVKLTSENDSIPNPAFVPPIVSSEPINRISDAETEPPIGDTLKPN